MIWRTLIIVYIRMEFHLKLCSNGFNNYTAIIYSSNPISNDILSPYITLIRISDQHSLCFILIEMNSYAGELSISVKSDNFVYVGRLDSFLLTFVLLLD